MVNELHYTQHGDFDAVCSQETVTSKFAGWDEVPIRCEIGISRTTPEYPHLGTVNVGADTVVFHMYRDAYEYSYFGYTIERRGEVLWRLPASAQKDHGHGNPISGADRAAFMVAMSKAAKGGGVLRLRFKVAYSGDAPPIDLQIPARRWTAALRDVRRASRKLGLSTAPW